MMWNGHHPMMWHGEEASSWAGSGGDWLMFFGMILIPVLLVLLVVFLMRQWTPQTGTPTGAAQAPPSPQPQLETPREILKRRYAAGEIDREDYLRRLGDL